MSRGLRVNQLPKEWEGRVHEQSTRARSVVRTAQVGRGTNSTERRMANDLQLQKTAGLIRDWEREPFFLPLAHRTTYTPDFVVWLLSNEVDVIETKGFLRPAGSIKLKVAARQYPCMRFKLVRWVRKTRQWAVREIAC